MFNSRATGPRASSADNDTIKGNFALIGTDSFDSNTSKTSQTSSKTSHTQEIRINRRLPTFIPRFEKLRRRCMLNLATEIRQKEMLLLDIDWQIRAFESTHDPSSAKDKKTLEDKRLSATKIEKEVQTMLTTLDNEVRAEVERRKLEDTTYAQQNELSVILFDLESQSGNHPSNYERSEWIMLDSINSIHSKVIFEDIADNNISTHSTIGGLEDFASSQQKSIQSMYRTRPKSILEQQKGVFKRDSSDGVVRYNYRRKRMWRVAIFAMGAALILYFGVGIIASTQTFSPIFVKQYYTISIIWSLTSSALLSWFIKIMDGEKKDVVTGFVGALALWLVVIQIGQARLSQQQAAMTIMTNSNQS